MTEQEFMHREAQLQAVCLQVMQSLPENVPHSLLLEALMINYVCLAEIYPCCTKVAGERALAAAQRLEKAASGRPANAPVH